MAVQTEKLPYGVGRYNAGWYALVIVLVALIGFGIYAYSQDLIHGLVITGMRNIGTMGGATWGLYIAFVVYFVGVSFAGITVAALIRLLNLERLKPIARMSELLTVVALIVAALAIVVDLGQPVRGVINLFRYARPQSPFFGTFTLVIAGYLFASLVYLYLDGRRDAAILAKVSGRLRGFHRIWAAGYRDTPAERKRHAVASFWLAIAILPLLVTAHSTLGFVFGLQVGRPGWFGALQAPGFVTLAGVSGVGMLIVIAALMRQLPGAKEKLSIEVFAWLGNFLLILTIAYLYFMFVEWLTNTYAASYAETRVTASLLVGDYAWIFWLSVAFLAIPVLLIFVQFVRQRYSLSLLVLSGLLVNLAAIGKRYLIVVPSQTHGSLLPYASGSYSPTWVEYSIVLSLFALGALLYIMFMKVFPIMEVPEPEEGGQA